MALYLNRCDFKPMSGTDSQHQGMVKVNVLYKEFICCILAWVKLLFHLVDYTTGVMLTVIFPTTNGTVLDNVPYRVFESYCVDT